MTPTGAGGRSDGLVARTSLEHRLARLAPLTVVQAFPGQGKTTLVRTWAMQQEERGDLVTWWDVTPDLDCPSLVRRALAGMLETSAGRRVVMVVDGAHHLGPGACEVLCETVLAHPHLHLVACADGRQHLTARARRHRLETSLIGWSELEVTAVELETFGRAWGHALTAEEAVHLHAQVGGWLLPARLVLDAPSSGGGPWQLDVAEEMVRREVLPAVAEWLDLEILGRLALGPHVTHQLAAELLVMRPSAVQGVLSNLTAAGVLERLSVDGRADRWRLPTLLRRVVRQDRERAGADDTDRHRAIARSLDREGGPDVLGDVLHHARLGANWELLADLWRRHAVRLVSERPAQTVAGFAGLPPSVTRDQLTLGIPAAMADALSATSESVDGRAALRALAVASRRALAAGLLPAEPAVRSVAVSAALLALRAEGRLDDALRLARAHDDERTGRRVVRAGLPAEPVAWFLLTWGSTLARRDLVGALDVTTRAFEVATQGGSRTISAHAAALSALLHTQLGTTDEGRRWLDVADRTVSKTPVTARLCRALLALDQLDLAAADAALDGLDPVAVNEDAWPFAVPVIARRAVLADDAREGIAQLRDLEMSHTVQVGDGDLARTFLDRGHVDLLLALGEVERARTFLGRRSTDAPWVRVPIARMAVMTGDHERAARLASSGVWETGVARRDTAELLMIAAAAHLLRGDEGAALEAFERGRVLAAGTGTLEPYVGMPGDLRDRLAELAGTPLEPGLLTALGRVATPYPSVAQTVALSPREHEVLQLMAEHASTADVARALTVSVNTVRKQQGSIYAKLGVTGRSAALARARELGLLPDESVPGERPGGSTNAS